MSPLFIDSLRDVQDRLALSVTQMTELFGVRRKTIYDWYEGIAPDNTQYEKLMVLQALLRAASEDMPLSRLSAVWKIPVNGASFMTVFNAASTQENLLGALQEKVLSLAPRLYASKVPRQLCYSAYRGTNELAAIERWTCID